MDIKITDVRCRKADAAFLIDDGKTYRLFIKHPKKSMFYRNKQLDYEC